MTTGEAENWQVYDPTGKRKYVTASEGERFLAAACWLSPPLRAFCYTLAYTGCRVSEALALTRDNLDTERRTLTFRTLKRRRRVFRVVPVPPVLVQLLANLPPAPQDARFWTMHRTTAWRYVKQVMNGTGITGPMATPKGLRHGYGIRAAGQNVPPNLIQRWMGHASSDTTAIYLDAVGAEERSFASRMW